MRTIAQDSSALPIELRLHSTKRDNAQGLPKLVLAGAFALKWVWWHTKSYVSIVAVLVLALGSLLVLQAHWLYRWLTHLPGIKLERKDVLKDAS